MDAEAGLVRLEGIVAALEARVLALEGFLGAVCGTCGGRPLSGVICWGHPSAWEAVLGAGWMTVPGSTDWRPRPIETGTTDPPAEPGR